MSRDDDHGRHRAPGPPCGHLTPDPACDVCQVRERFDAYTALDAALERLGLGATPEQIEAVRRRVAQLVAKGAVRESKHPPMTVDHLAVAITTAAVTGRKDDLDHWMRYFAALVEVQHARDVDHRRSDPVGRQRGDRSDPTATTAIGFAPARDAVRRIVRQAGRYPEALAAMFEAATSNRRKVKHEPPPRRGSVPEVAAAESDGPHRFRQTHRAAEASRRWLAEKGYLLPGPLAGRHGANEVYLSEDTIVDDDDWDLIAFDNAARLAKLDSKVPRSDEDACAHCGLQKRRSKSPLPAGRVCAWCYDTRRRSGSLPSPDAIEKRRIHLGR